MKLSDLCPAPGCRRFATLPRFTRLAGVALAALACALSTSAAQVTQQAYFKSSNTSPGDIFGVSVAISGDTLVVGAPYESSNAQGVNGVQDNDGSPYAGAAYVFVRLGDQWVQQAYLKASNADVADFFGWSVGISGNTIIVGAFGESSSGSGLNADPGDNLAFGAGAAYIFVRNGSNWTQQAYLKASNANAEDYFGISVAVDGDVAVVGAEEEASAATGVNGNQSDNSAPKSGAAYVFNRSGTTWTQQAYLKATTAVAGDYFGCAVSVSGETVVVGAPRQEESAGAAHVFARQNGTWRPQGVLRASNRGLADRFGAAVAISGDTLVAGAFAEDSDATGVNGNGSNNNAPSSGAAYVFARTGTNWQQQAYLKASNTSSSWESSGALFGYAVAVSSNAVLVGAPNECSAATGVNGNQTDFSALGSGAAYLFTRTGTNWTQQAYLKACNTEADDGFGFSVALSGSTLLAGAYYEDGGGIGVNSDDYDNTAGNAGAAYLFGAGGGGTLPASLTITLDAGGGQRIRVTGEPNASYQLQRAPAVTGPWAVITTLNTSPAGVAEFVDASTGSPFFYRTLKP